MIDRPSGLWPARFAGRAAPREWESPWILLLSRRRAPRTRRGCAQLTVGDGLRRASPRCARVPTRRAGPAISRHLAVRKAAGLVVARGEGTRRRATSPAGA